ncbi:MAG: DUF3179 domain-containing protein [Acidimicrobiales bacterium]
MADDRPSPTDAAAANEVRVRRRSIGPLLAAVVASVLVIAACSNGGGDAAVDGAGSAEADAEPDSDTDTSDRDTSDRGTSDEASSEAQPAPSLGDSEGGIPDPNFDYDAVDYEAEPVDNALLGNRSNPLFPPPVIEPTLIRSGGVPPDGIPPIDDPRFVPVADADFVGDEEAVISVAVGGEARAYPIQILIWHEIVNDEFGDVPVTVTYCPLCNSALAFDRRVGSRTLDFGTSGELYQSALVMYDRQTGSLWAHFTGQGLVGHYAGAELAFVPAQTISFAQFRDAHPGGLVLTRETGASRPYGQNPYPGYDFEGSDPIGAFFNGEIDRTLLAKARIVGVNDDAGSVAVRLEDLAAQPVIPITASGRNLVVFHRSGLASALESGEVDGGRDIGQTGVFEAEAADGTALTFTADGDDFVDDQTGSTWNVVGQAFDGPLAGESLTAVTHLDTFWFAWASYRPDTTVIQP